MYTIVYIAVYIDLGGKMEVMEIAGDILLALFFGGFFHNVRGPQHHNNTTHNKAFSQ